MKESQIVTLGMILGSIIIGIYFYPQLPERMAVHWNMDERADNYFSKFWALSFLPLFSIGLYLLFLAIPRIDPLRENIEKFRKYYDGMVLFLIFFLFYLYLLTISWNLDIRFNMIQGVAPAIGILFYYLGILTEHAKRNWFVGIRTPWTLSNEVVWERTHKIGARLFKVCGVVAFLGIVLEKLAIYLIVLPVLLVAIYTTVYSYFEFQKQARM